MLIRAVAVVKALKFQGCSLRLERLGLEAEKTSRLVSVLKVERLGLESLEKSNVLVSSRP